ncbi:hypothetical protein CRENBAI_003878 [Crenichthys baileyi]|uniref:Reverse transcriptase domain-containing protein n=1 Tax=Crenichthys baileyi TaxID=28760 RepID=A0AAV9SR97_9TELE
MLVLMDLSDVFKTVDYNILTGRLDRGTVLSCMVGLSQTRSTLCHLAVKDVTKQRSYVGFLNAPFLGHFYSVSTSPVTTSPTIDVIYISVSPSQFVPNFN